jgi:hypothetical protein
MPASCLQADLPGCSFCIVSSGSGSGFCIDLAVWAHFWPLPAVCTWDSTACAVPPPVCCSLHHHILCMFFFTCLLLGVHFPQSMAMEFRSTWSPGRHCIPGLPLPACNPGVSTSCYLVEVRRTAVQLHLTSHVLILWIYTGWACSHCYLLQSSVAYISGAEPHGGFSSACMPT